MNRRGINRVDLFDGESYYSKETIEKIASEPQQLASAFYTVYECADLLNIDFNYVEKFFRLRGVSSQVISGQRWFTKEAVDEIAHRRSTLTYTLEQIREMIPECPPNLTKYLNHRGIKSVAWKEYSRDAIDAHVASVVPARSIEPITRREAMKLLRFGSACGFDAAMERHGIRRLDVDQKRAKYPKAEVLNLMKSLGLSEDEELWNGSQVSEWFGIAPMTASEFLKFRGIYPVDRGSTRTFLWKVSDVKSVSDISVKETFGVAEICELLGKTARQVKSCLSKYGIKRVWYGRYRKTDIEQLIAKVRGKQTAVA